MTVNSIYRLDEKKVIKKGDSITPAALAETQKFFNANKKFVYNLDCYWAAVFCFDSTGTKKFYEHKFYCHNPMNDCFRPGATSFFTLLHKNISPETQRPMLEFILSADGPWGEGWKHCSVLRDEDNDGYPVGVLLRNVNETNIKVFTNGIIATRFSTGWGSSFFFNRFVQAGFNNHEALLLASMFTWSDMKINTGQSFEYMFCADPYRTNPDLFVTKMGPHSYDTPFRYGGYTLLSSKNYLSSKPDCSNHAILTSYSDKEARANPCNYIWVSKGKSGLSRISSCPDCGEFSDPFSLKDFLFKTEIKNPGPRVKEVRDAFSLAEKEAVTI